MFYLICPSTFEMKLWPHLLWNLDQVTFVQRVKNIALYFLTQSPFSKFIMGLEYDWRT